MQIHEAWWLAALVLGIVEMLTGTFYLLVLALGCAAAGGVALAGGSFTLQLLAAAAFSFAGWALIWRSRRSRDAREEVAADMVLDVGARIQIEHWDEPHRTIARYRGAAWQVELADSSGPGGRPGPHVIRGVVGNRLVVTPSGN
ncbi:MAG: NfeD family protein [Burkholderiaceae bacterium]|jgi:membrane protein implicated in regulation of membrane protease activity|nr:NfeD family protein [Burkholderiaceae bacterium]MEB2320280.1 NfeD family protein [Pseudomonadota bacterium]